MPVIPVFTVDENGVPLNDLELYIDGVLVDGDFDYGESYDFPCGKDFKIELKKTLWYGATETICHNNPVISNNDVSTIVSGLITPPTCLFPPDPHTPNSTITVNVNGNIYTLNYNYYTPTINTMLNDIALLINANTSTTFWEATVSGNCLTIKKTQYTANSYNGQIFSVTIHREFTPTFIVENLGPTGNIIGDPCELPPNQIDGDEYLWRLTWREQQEDFTQTLFVDTDAPVPFEFENTLYIPCCDAWSVANNDNDGILEAGELNPMHIVLATPSFTGAISNFYLVKYPCDNLVCAYEMTNIPYCHYEYNFNVTPNEKEDIIKSGRNTCYDYRCADIYTVGLTVYRCSEQAIEYLQHCGCGIKEVAQKYDIATDVSYQQVKTDLLYPEILELDIDRPPACEQLCSDCNVYCKSYCYQETDTINYFYSFSYPCCDSGLVIIKIYDNGTLIHSNTISSGASGTFNYQWQTTGLHELILEATTCCGTFKKTYRIYVVPCKPYDIDFDWTLDCDCNYKGSNSKVRECNCVPVGEEVLFTPTYVVPDCGCPVECEDVIIETETDVFTEQDNGNDLSGGYSKVQSSLFNPALVSPQKLYFVVDDAQYPYVGFNVFSSPSYVAGVTNGIVGQFFINQIIPLSNKELPCLLLYTFQNSYLVLPTEQYRLEFTIQFRYQNRPDAPYPSYGLPPNFPFKQITPSAIDTLGNTVPNIQKTKVTFSTVSNSSEYVHHTGTPILPFVTSNANPPQLQFKDPSIIAYKFVIKGNGAGTAISGILLDMLLSNELFLSNQYIVEIMISDISLIIISQTVQQKCYKEYIVEWFVDDDKVKTIAMTSPNYGLKDDRLEYVFNEAGCHNVRLEVSNCAGVCSQEYEVCAGDSITLSKDTCYEWKIEDCKKYQQCYINGNVNFPYDHTTLNIVTLPVNAEWVQLEQDKLYYDEREDKYFVYNNIAPLIILYADLYNSSLPHYSSIGIIDYPYVIYPNQNPLLICKEYKAIVELYDINNNLVANYPYEIYPYNGQNTYLPIHKDGIYKVKFRVYSKLPFTNQFSELECQYEWYLIELCGIYKCYENMFEKLQCATDCECPDEKEIAKLREKINRFMAFFNLLNLGVEAEFSQYATMNSIVLDEMSLATNIDEQINALIKLCNECGCACKQTVPSKPYCSERILTDKTSLSLNNNSLSSGKCPCEK